MAALAAQPPAPDGFGRRTTITPAGKEALIALFEGKKWRALPRQPTLDKDLGYMAIAHLHGLVRTQTSRQFATWRKFGKNTRQGTTASPDQIRAFVDETVGDINELNVASLDLVSKGPFAKRRPSTEAGISELLRRIRRSDGAEASTAAELSSRSALNLRVGALAGIVADNYASSRSALRHSSVSFELAINVSRDAWIAESREKLCLTELFGSIDIADLKAETLDHFCNILLYHVDSSLCTCFRRRFYVAAKYSMEIPIVDDYEPSSVLMKEVIYNIAGYLLSSFRKKSELLRATDGQTSALFASFAAVHCLRPEDATRQGLPVGLVKRQTRGGLVYASRDFYLGVCALEYAYHHCLSLTAAVALGPNLLLRAHAASSSWAPFQESLASCLVESPSTQHCLDSAPLVNWTQHVYIRLRGKDFVKALLSELRLKQAASQAVAHRQTIASATSSASSRRRKRTEAVQRLGAEAGSEEEERLVDKSEGSSDDEDGDNATGRSVIDDDDAAGLWGEMGDDSDEEEHEAAKERKETEGGAEENTSEPQQDPPIFRLG
jgi:hypothetical protein